MEKPLFAAEQLAILSLEPGPYYWCQCGRSKNQPFCDGSHKRNRVLAGRVFRNGKEASRPLPMQVAKTPPFCDGTHKTL